MTKFFIVFVVLGFSCLLASAQINVTNYGARGDYMTLTNVTCTSNSVNIFCATQPFVSSDTNKIVEIWNAGTFQTVSNETLVAVITNVVNASNVLVSVAASRSATNILFGCFGTDNKGCFSNAIVHASAPTDTIIIPAGKYLLMDTNVNVFFPYGILINRGGLTFQGQGSVTLMGNGGWRNTTAGTYQSVGSGRRGWTVSIEAPTTNNSYPLIFTNLIFDGGVLTGQEGGGNNGPDSTTGEGWDVTHHAINLCSEIAANLLPDQIECLGCTFQHWRGEMIIGTTTSPNGYVTVNNSLFFDGDASCLNMPQEHDINGCTFTNTFFLEEFYQGWATNPIGSFFRFNTVSNIYGGTAIAINGGRTGAPGYQILSNTLYLTVEQAMLTTQPGNNIRAEGNTQYGGSALAALGAAGYQSLWNSSSSNIVLIHNWGTNLYYGLEIEAGAWYQRVENCIFSSNTLYGTYQNLLFTYGTGTNNVISDNQVTNFLNIDESQALEAWTYDTNNSYIPLQSTITSGVTNSISYAKGSFQTVWGNHAGGIVVTNDFPAKIPQQAFMLVSNFNDNGFTYPVFANSASGPVTNLAPHTTVMLTRAGLNEASYWTNAAFSLPPATYHLIVNNGSGSGYYGAGTSVPIVGNTGTGYWSADANIANTALQTTTYTMPAADSSATWNDTTPAPAGLVIMRGSFSGKISTQ